MNTFSEDSAGFVPLAPPTVWQGWDAFVHQAPVPALEAGDPVWSQTQREDYHSELAVMRTPAMDSVFTTVRRLLLVNRRQQAGARRGLIISGPATTGKTTTMMALGRSFHLADQRQHPGRAERRPVLFISVPPAATPKMLVSEFARFLGMPITDRLNQTQITSAVCDLLRELGTQLVALLGMPPISSGPRSNSSPAAASPSLVSRRTSSPPRVRPPSTDRPCLRRSLSAPRWEAVRASFRAAAVFFVVCRYVRCGEDSRWI